MPKKRVASKKKPGGKLGEIKLYSLLGGESMKALLSGFKEEHFKTDEERQQAWEENRDSLFYYEVVEEELKERAAYTRAPAWWDYEAEEARKEGETEKEYLIRFNLVTAWDRERELEPLRHLTEEEQREAVKDYIRDIDLHTEKLRARYMEHTKGEKAIHDSKTWHDYYKEYAERAAILEEHAAGGKAAGRAWREALEDIKAYSEQEEAKEERAREAEEARKAWEEKKQQKGIKGQED